MPWRAPAHPHAALPGGRELVTDALADHLALELGEGEQDVEREAAQASRCASSELNSCSRPSSLDFRV
jgi:hypothetical protein